MIPILFLKKIECKTNVIYNFVQYLYSLIRNNIIEKLRQESAVALPGWEAQKKMSPSYRGDLQLEKILEMNPKRSAVAIVLYEKEGNIHFILTQRHEYEGTHSGQVSFPGGKQESSESILETAIRETYEEVGVGLDASDLCLALTPIYIPPSHFLVSPYVFYVPSISAFQPDPYEVKEVLEVPLHHILETEKKIITDISSSRGMIKEVPAYALEDRIVWGATAIILSELEAILLTYKV